MMTPMDFRFPELSAPRDPHPDSVSRTREHAESDFAGYLDSSLRDRQADEPREAETRDVAPRRTPAAREADEDRPARSPSDADEKRDRAAASVEPSDASQPAPRAPETNETPVVAETNAPVDESLSDGPEQGAAETPASPAVQDAPRTAAPNAAVLPVPTIQEAPPPVPASPSGANPLASTSAPAQQRQGQEPAMPSNEALAATARPQDAPVAPVFAGELAVATARAAESTPASPKPQNVARTQPAAGQATPTHPAATDQNAIVSFVASAGKPSGESGDESAKTGSRGFASPQPMQSQASASMPADDDANFAQIAVPPRQTQAPANSASRPADAAAEAALPSGLDGPEAGVDAAPPASANTNARSDGPSRPFASVAPGLTVAAQVTAQQTPEQASAAERLAQLAGAQEMEASDAADIAGRNAVTAAESAASPVRLEQTVQADMTTPRTMTIDVASAAAAARHARPAFHPLVAQVAMHVAQAATDGNDRISIRLSPADLGRIDVRLDFGPDGRVQAVFAADRPQTVELLQRDARDLERALQDAGLRADSGSLSFNLRGDGRNGSPTFAETTATERRDEPVAEIALPQVQAYAAGSAAAGRLDIRI